MTRFSSFTDDELDAMEKAICNLCNKRLTHLVDEVRRERRYRESKKVESEGHEISEEELKFAGDKLFVCIPLPQYGDEICKVQLVMTKKIFQECYKKWIKPQETEAIIAEESDTDKQDYDDAYYDYYRGAQEEY